MVTPKEITSLQQKRCGFFRNRRQKVSPKMRFPIAGFPNLAEILSFQASTCWVFGPGQSVLKVKAMPPQAGKKHKKPSDIFRPMSCRILQKRKSKGHNIQSNSFQALGFQSFRVFFSPIQRTAAMPWRVPRGACQPQEQSRTRRAQVRAIDLSVGWS